MGEGNGQPDEKPRLDDKTVIGNDATVTDGGGGSIADGSCISWADGGSSRFTCQIGVETSDCEACSDFMQRCNFCHLCKICQICIQTQGETCPDECVAAGEEGMEAVADMIMGTSGPCVDTCAAPAGVPAGVQHPCFAESEVGIKTAEQFWPVSRQICESDTCAGATCAPCLSVARRLPPPLPHRCYYSIVRPKYPSISHRCFSSTRLTFRFARVLQQSLVIRYARVVLEQHCGNCTATGLSGTRADRISLK